MISLKNVTAKQLWGPG